VIQPVLFNIQCDTVFDDHSVVSTHAVMTENDAFALIADLAVSIPKQRIGD
jgi:hypothetical protein